MRCIVRKHNLLRTLLVLAALCGLTSASAATITVMNTESSGPGSLRQAIFDAQENDTIVFGETVRGAIQAGGEPLHITKGLTILGPGANLVAIDGGLASPVVLINAPGHSVTISGLNITRGYSDQWSVGGGGIYNDANLTLTACAIAACSAYGSFGGFPAHAGGIRNATGGSLQMIGCTLSENYVRGGNGFHGGAGGDANGSGLWNEQGASATLRNCTITGNSAVGGTGSCLFPPICVGTPGFGGGAGIESQGELIVESCTIVSNSASSGGGGIRVTAGSAQITNTIIAQNTAPSAPDAQGSVSSGGFNLVSRINGSFGFTAIGDQTGTSATPLDPILGPLQDNGGTTATMALLPGSPAIDKGNAATIATDERGFRRRDNFPSIPNATGGDGSDIGAFEVRHAGLFNISTRARVLPGDDALIAGFIITPGRTKELIVRGIGPSLSIEGRLEDPTIEVYDDHGVSIAYNDNWPDAASATDIQRTLPPANPLESALWGVINPAAYTVILRGRNETSGIALVEAYDLDAAADSGLGNISTRGFVGTGDEVMICGIIVGPAEFSTNTRVVMRALGPSLAQFGIPNALDNPSIDVRDGNGTQLAFNDDWQNDPTAETVAALGLAPEDPHESATVVTASGGAYTAIVRGESESVGVALVEAYEVGPE